MGLAILIRPAMVFFLPFAALWFLWRRRALEGVAFVVVAVLCVAPWTIRNHRVHGRWIFVASEGGVTFWTGQMVAQGWTQRAILEAFLSSAQFTQTVLPKLEALH